MKKLTYKIAISFITLIVLIVLVYGVGIYKYHWSRYGVKNMVRIVPYPAAFVGPFWITIYQFEYKKAFIEHFYNKTGAEIQDEAELNRQIMDRLIEQKIVESNSARQGLSISQRDIDNEYQKIVDENNGEENVKNMLQDLYGISLKDLRIMIKEKLVLEKFKNETLVSVHLYQILIKDQNRANDVLNQLKNGGNFEELAKKFSEDEGSKDKGGDLGFVQRGAIVSGKPMSKEFEQAAFSLNTGEISPSLVPTEFGYLIFKVTEKKGKIDKSYQDWLTETKARTRVIKFINN